MADSTLLKRSADMTATTVSDCHDGHGDIRVTTVLAGPETQGRHLNFMHDDVLPPGTSIGVHQHTHDEEYYYVLSGSGVMTLDGESFEVHAGDIAVVFPGGSHGLANTGSEDVHLIVFSVS